MMEKTFLSLVCRWPVEQLKREAAGTEDCRQMDAIIERITETAPLPHRRQRFRIQCSSSHLCDASRSPM